MDERLGKYFSRWEFERSQTASRHNIDNGMTATALVNATRLVKNVLDPLRVKLASPININSGYRSIRLNKVLNGSWNSQHCLGEAADIEAFKLDNYELANLIKDNFEFDQLILECYHSGSPRSGWVHVSYREGENRNEVLTWDGKRFEKGLIA